MRVWYAPVATAELLLYPAAAKVRNSAPSSPGEKFCTPAGIALVSKPAAGRSMLGFGDTIDVPLTSDSQDCRETSAGAGG